MLPTEGTFALKNVGSGKTVSFDGSDPWYPKVGEECTELRYQPDPDGVWGVLAPTTDDRVFDFFRSSQSVGLWGKHSGANQRWRMEEKLILSKSGDKAMFQKEDGRIGMKNPSCDDEGQQWEVLESCNQ